MYSQNKSVVYTVQATKAPPPALTDALGRIRQHLRGAEAMDSDEFDLCALRLFADHKAAESEAGELRQAEGLG